MRGSIDARQLRTDGNNDVAEFRVALNRERRLREDSDNALASEREIRVVDDKVVSELREALADEGKRQETSNAKSTQLGRECTRVKKRLIAIQLVRSHLDSDEEPGS